MKENEQKLKSKRSKNSKRTKLINKENKKDAKKIKKESKKHPKLRLAIKICVISFLILGIIGVGILAGVFIGVMRSDTAITLEMLTIGYTNSKMLDKNGNIIAELSGDENREFIPLEEMPKYLQEAFVSIEDERFEKHKGVDIKRTAAATIKYGLSKLGIGSADYGGSTITQQLVKLITKEDERAWQRKVKEIARAFKVEQLISKDEILELYLNTINLGGFEKNVCGVEVASNYYFNKSASQLDIAESAFLAGINHAPNTYNPFYETDRTERIKTRTNVVLGKMKELGKIEEDEYNIAIEEVNNGLPFNEGEVKQNMFSYHTEAAINQILDQLQEEQELSREGAKLYLYGNGLTIHTTQDNTIQTRLENEVALDKYITTSRQTKIKDKNGNETDKYEKSQAAVVIIDHKTGQVLATVGALGEKTDVFGLNRATQSKRQTGSSMKPLAVIVPGLAEGILTAGTVYDDIPYGGYHNYSWDYNGLVTVRYAIEVSLNIPHVKMIAQIGPEKSLEYLKKMGITSLLSAKESNEMYKKTGNEYYKNGNDEIYSLALGGTYNGISPLEMATAYATIANDGVCIEPTFYTKVEDLNGNTVLEPKQKSQRAFSEQVAYVAKTIIKQPVVGGSGTAGFAQVSGMDTAAKTGTTNSEKDRWFCGFTPYYTAAAWYGFDEPETVRYGNGNPAGRIWAAVMKDIHKGLQSKRFTKPSGVVSATICKDSGLLATEPCKKDQRGNRTYSEYFISGTVPGKTCTCHVELEICEETGKIANENCPKKITKVFITRPNSQNSTSWQKAKDAKYMAPVDTCNIHLTPPEENNNVNEVTNEILNNIINNIVDNNSTNETNNNTNDMSNDINGGGTTNTMTNTVP